MENGDRYVPASAGLYPYLLSFRNPRPHFFSCFPPKFRYDLANRFTEITFAQNMQRLSLKNKSPKAPKCCSDNIRKEEAG